MLIVAAGFIGIFLIFQFMVFPLIDKRERLQRALLVKSQAFTEIQTLAADYNNIKKQSDSAREQIAEKKAGFTLFSFLDRLAGEAEMKDFITYMKPSTTSPKDSPYKIAKVEMRFQNITLEQLSTYLFKVETSRNLVWVKRLSISKDTKEPGFVNAILQIETSEM